MFIYTLEIFIDISIGNEYTLGFLLSILEYYVLLGKKDFELKTRIK